MSKKSLKAIADLEVESHDFEGKITIKQYLKLQLVTLWEEGEGFSGKRPFGNSGWDFDVYKVLIQHGVIKGKLDTDGFIDEIDTEDAKEIILKIIRSW